MRWCRIASKNPNRRADLVDRPAGNITANANREFAGERGSVRGGSAMVIPTANPFVPRPPYVPHSSSCDSSSRAENVACFRVSGDQFTGILRVSIRLATVDPFRPCRRSSYIRRPGILSAPGSRHSSMASSQFHPREITQIRPTPFLPFLHLIMAKRRPRIPGTNTGAR
jgi:hypothetical protein